MQLARLVQSIEGAIVSGSLDIDVSGIVYDSRQAHPGCMFCCIEGFKSDGHNFIADAIGRGARVLCLQKKVEIPDGVTAVAVSDTRVALARMAAEFYGHPSRKLKVTGVTGTNGKTTTTFLIAHILNSMGSHTGLMGTLFVKIGEELEMAKHTTPEALDLQSTLSRMVSAGMEYAVLEVSSHALSLNRVDDCRFERAVFTNLTQDHLDFHLTMDDYFKAKLRFFSFLQKEQGHLAIINGDDPRASAILASLEAPALTYGLREKNLCYRAENVRVTPQGVDYDLHAGDLLVHVRLSISGLFNVYNSLAAIATVCSYGISPAAAAEAMRDFEGVKGRFQMIRAGQDFSVVVDYAHTPDGLRNILNSAREITQGTLTAVFGCGGDRDRTKRPIMGEIAAAIADRVILTSDNPRTEEPEKILQNIEEGVTGADKSYEKIVDRKEAIFRALSQAKKGDTIVIAGKGHENYQIFRDRTIHFDDAEVVQEYFAGGQPPR